MDQVQVFDLIDGTYTPNEAREVLLALVNTKINFNNMAAFSYSERFGTGSHHQKRATELKSVRSALIDLIDQAASNGYRLQVKGSFEVNFVEQETTAQEPVAMQFDTTERIKRTDNYLA